MVEAACDAYTSWQGDVAYCQTTVRERLERLPGKGDVQGGSSGFQRDSSARVDPLCGSVDPDSGS